MANMVGPQSQPPQNPNMLPQGGGIGGPPSQMSNQDNLHALQRAIDSMEEKGLQEDPRYSQLVALRARSTNEVAKHNFTQQQLHLFK